jgi:succinate-semialdehyde dehydrogenase/glutarate-semialdehyde dehydrogenase
VNTIARVYDELPFGAARGSGFGREHGVEAMEHYTEYRTLVYAD